MRAMRESAIEFLGTLKMVPQNRFDFGALLRCHRAITHAYFEGAGAAAACFLASAAICLQRSCKPPGIAAHFANASADSEKRFS